MPYYTNPTRRGREDAPGGYPVPTSAPFDLASYRWLVADGAHVPIIRLTRRTVTVDRYGQRHELKRRTLERTGVDHDGDVRFSVTRYHLDLPDDMEQTG